MEAIAQEVAWMATQILFHGRRPDDFALRVPRGGAAAVSEETAVALGLSIPPGPDVELRR